MATVIPSNVPQGGGGGGGGQPPPQPPRPLEQPQAPQVPAAPQAPLPAQHSGAPQLVNPTTTVPIPAPPPILGPPANNPPSPVPPPIAPNNIPREPDAPGQQPENIGPQILTIQEINLPDNGFGIPPMFPAFQRTIPFPFL
jgi:hypothetical protein